MQPVVSFRCIESTLITGTHTHGHTHAHTHTHTRARDFNVMHHFLWIKINISLRFAFRRSLLAATFDNAIAVAAASASCC